MKPDEMEALDKDIYNAQQMIKNFPVVQSDSHLARNLPSFSNTEQFTFEGQFKEFPPPAGEEMFQGRKPTATVSSESNTANFRGGAKSSKSPIRSVYSSK